jgi:hypothetical protein
MNVKSERLKKLESELQDLHQWLKLGLVPKKDLEKHRCEIGALEQKIGEERERLRFLKESGALEEPAPPKKSPHQRQAFPDTASMPDIDVVEEGVTDGGFDAESDSFELETTTGEEPAAEPAAAGEEPEAPEEADEEDPFSDRNRWRRGVIEDPDADNW